MTMMATSIIRRLPTSSSKTTESQASARTSQPRTTLHFAQWNRYNSPASPCLRRGKGQPCEKKGTPCPLFQRPWNLHELPHLFRRERGRDELILEGVGQHEIEAPHLIGPHRALREEVVAPLTHELRRYLCELLVEQQRIIVGIHEINGVPIALHVASDRVFLRKRL